jgi:hypothetical protein
MHQVVKVCGKDSQRVVQTFVIYMVEILLHTSNDPVVQELLEGNMSGLGLTVEHIVDVFPRRPTGLPVV